MFVRIALIASPLLLAACDGGPAGVATDPIRVVQGGASAPVAPIASAAAAPDPTTAREPTLSIEESARINTAEMWSEPIAADAEEIVIE